MEIWAEYGFIQSREERQHQPTQLPTNARNVQYVINFI